MRCMEETEASELPGRGVDLRLLERTLSKPAEMSADCSVLAPWSQHW